MAAVSEHELSEEDFIGHVFSKPSPILTWRAAGAKTSNVARITPGLPADRRDEAMSDRFSRAPTKRMVAWPVLPQLASARPWHKGSRMRALRALGTLVGFSLLCGSAIALCVYVLLGEAPGMDHAKLASVRVGVPHVTGSSFDTLLQSAQSAQPAQTAGLAPIQPATMATEPVQPHHSAGALATAAHGPRPHVQAQARAGTAHKWHRTQRVASHGT